MSNPEVLDITAGYRTMWKGKTQNVLFLDVRKEVKPDIVASNEYLPFKNETFKRVVYDPPHLIQPNINVTTSRISKDLAKRYSYWTKKEHLMRNIILVNKEVYRVLSGNGILFCKFTPTRDGHVTVEMFIRILENFEVKRIRRDRSKVKTLHGSKDYVYHITMGKRNLNEGNS